MIAADTEQLGILARWYAEPLSKEEAKALLGLAEKREQALLKRHGKSSLAPLLKLIALCWLDEPTEDYYHYLESQPTRSIHQQILRPLIYGQLLMSRHVEDAMEYIDNAFNQSRLLLRPEDYFVLVKRHLVLKSIPLSSEAINGETLEALLKTGEVIARMKASEGGKAAFWHDPNDTYG